MRGIRNRTIYISVFMSIALAAAQAAGPVITKGPYIQNPSPTAMTIQWESNADSKTTVTCVPVGKGDASMAVKVAGKMHEKVRYSLNPGDKNSKKISSYLYRARLTGLKPDTVYAYRVSMEGVEKRRAQFQTWPEKTDRVTFIAYGDTRTQPATHRAVVQNFDRHKPAFILHTGDLVSNGSIYSEWSPQFFDPLKDVMDHIPMISALGNHEYGAVNLLRLFDLPGGRTWFSFTYGPLHVVVLDYSEQGKDVLEWLKNDLAAAKAPWKIVMYHIPTFNFGGHMSAHARKTFLPLLEEYGVDVVLAGHSHVYERYVPLRRAGMTEGNPITFITTGGGGAPLYGIAPKHHLLAKTAKKYHYCVFAVDRKKLQMRTIGADGEEIDSLTIKKRKGRYNNSYLARTQPMEAAILAQALLSFQTPQIDSAPTTTKSVTVPVKIRFPDLTGPASLTVSLTEDSAQHYKAEPVTVEVRRADGRAKASITVTALHESVTEEPKKGSVRPPALRLLLTARTDGVQEIFETGRIE